MLRSRLYEYELQKKQRKTKRVCSTYRLGPNSILYPSTYQLVKDLRNKVENTNPTDVLNGNIDEFIEAGIISR